MGAVLSLLVLAPVVWALLGARGAHDVAAWALANAPTVAPSSVPSAGLLAAVCFGAVLGAGRARVATTHVSTVAHELGHGLAAGLMGAAATSLRLHRDGSGVAHTRWRARRPAAAFVVSAAGYLAPGTVALASMSAVLVGLGALWLAYLMTVIALALVLTIRSWWGALVVVALGAAGWAVLAVAPPAAAPLVVAGLAGVLAGGGVIDALGQWRLRTRDPGLDAAAMAAQTRLPVGVFAGFHLLAATALAVATLTMPLWG